MPKDPAPGGHEHPGTNNEDVDEFREGIRALFSDEEESDVIKTVTTEFHLWSTVLKEQCDFFEANMLRWSEQQPL